MTTTSVLPPLQASVPIGKDDSGKPVYGSDYFIRWVNTSLSSRLGGTTSSTLPGVVTDLALTEQGLAIAQQNISSLQNEVGSLEQFPPVASPQNQDDPSGRLESLEALVNKLAQDIQALQQGTTS